MKGHGSEPRVEFDRQLVHFPAVLPFADGSEVEVLVSNIQSYPVEIYSLEFDKQYLEEEEVSTVIAHIVTLYRCYCCASDSEVGEGIR